jgi:hypothetical protein
MTRYAKDGSLTIIPAWSRAVRTRCCGSGMPRAGSPIGAPLQGHQDSVESVAFSPDGTRIVSGSFDTTLQLWDAKSGEPVGAPLKGHENSVRSVAFSPYGTHRLGQFGHDAAALGCQERGALSVTVSRSQESAKRSGVGISQGISSTEQNQSASHVPPVTVYPQLANLWSDPFASASPLRRASGSDARKVQASAGFRISSPSTRICSPSCDSRIGVQPAAQSCRRRGTASRDPDLDCSAESSDAPPPSA